MSAAGLFDAPIETSSGEGYRRSDKGGTDVWLTPPHILRALGDFDLDPCAAPEPRPWPTAARHIAPPEDGLRAAWSGRVWMNPPYTDTGPWLAKLAQHGQGVALIFARTETVNFQRWVWREASALMFLAGRLAFHRHDGRPARHSAAAPSVLIAYGSADAFILQRAADNGALAGQVVHLR